MDSSVDGNKDQGVKDSNSDDLDSSYPMPWEGANDEEINTEDSMYFNNFISNTPFLCHRCNGSFSEIVDFIKHKDKHSKPLH